MTAEGSSGEDMLGLRCLRWGAQGHSRTLVRSLG